MNSRNTAIYQNTNQYTFVEELTAKHGGAFSHITEIVKDAQGNVFYKKKFEDQNLKNTQLSIAIEATAGQLFNLLMPYQPQTLLAKDENNNIYVLSQEIPGYTSLSRLAKKKHLAALQKTINGESCKGLGSTLTAAYFLNETDAKLGNLGLAHINDKYTVIKIDNDRCLSSLRRPHQFARKSGQITEQGIRRMPFMNDYHANHWMDRIQGGFLNAEYLDPNNPSRLLDENLPDYPGFRLEVNEMMLKIILMPESLVKEIAGRNTNDEEIFQSVTAEIASRKNQMLAAVLQNDDFKLFMQTPQAKACLASTIQEMQAYQNNNNLSDHSIAQTLTKGFDQLRRQIYDPVRDKDRINIVTLNKNIADKVINKINSETINKVEDDKKNGKGPLEAYLTFFKAANDLSALLDIAHSKALFHLKTSGDKSKVNEYIEIKNKADPHIEVFMNLANQKMKELFDTTEEKEFIEIINNLESDTLFNAIKNIPKNKLKQYSKIALTEGRISFLSSLDDINPELLGSVLNKKDKNNMKAIDRFALQGNADVVAGLVKLDKMIPNDFDKKGLLFIHHLGIQGHVHVLEKLYQVCNNAELSTLLRLRDENGMTLLHHAAQNGHINILKFINEKLGPIAQDFWMKPDKKGFYPIHYAAQQGNLAILQTLKTMNVKLLDQAKKPNKTAAIVAIKNQQWAAAIMLLQNTKQLPGNTREDDKINAPDVREELVTQFIENIKAETQHLQGEAKTKAIRARLDPVIKTPSKNALGHLLQTPKTTGFVSKITQAVGEKELDKITMEFLEYLPMPNPALHAELEKLADLSNRYNLEEAKNPQNIFALNTASVNVANAMETVKDTMDALTINQRNKQGLTAAHLVAKLQGISEEERLKLITLLKNKGANLNLQDAEGNTPMHFAMKNPKSEEVTKDVFKALKTDVNINLVNTSNETPAILAANSPDEDDAHNRLLMLRKEGADLFQTNQAQKMPVLTLLMNPQAGVHTIDFLLGLKLNSAEKKSFLYPMELQPDDKNKLIDKLVKYVSNSLSSQSKSVIVATRESRSRLLSNMYNNENMLGYLLNRVNIPEKEILQGLQPPSQQSPNDIIVSTEQKQPGRTTKRFL